MPFDQKTRNLLAGIVTECRRLLVAEFTAKLQEIYGIQPGGALADLDTLGNLSDEQREVARLLRERIEHLRAGLVASGGREADTNREAVARVIREQAFTVLNRLAALRLCEERGLATECVRRGVNSDGFQLFLQSAGAGLGDTHETYTTYLQCLFDELGTELGVLFDRFSPLGMLFPRRDALAAVLNELNGLGKTAAREDIGPEAFAHLWQEDETIGWIYQYWNDPGERKKMRDESSAPRNSRELAVRNQFFTPRYVVEFLTDNTLGRIWYEMTQGNTKLKEQCRYLVRRPTEIFLNPGENPPNATSPSSAGGVSPSPGGEGQGEGDPKGLSQEELLKQPVHIPHRPLKDPRTILMLDPACGSMHFGLYASDLFEVIYSEAWEIAKSGNAPPGTDSSFTDYCSLITDHYPSKEAFLRDVPRLIIEHNIHGIDIDPRAVQIAGLSLWLRAQRAWKDMGLAPAQRPAIKRSNIVCAEPMPGEKHLLREFVDKEFPAPERPVFLLLLETIWDKLQLAGEAGSLLKIEEEVKTAIEVARSDWEKIEEHLPGLAADRPLATDQRPLATDFWERIEERIYTALRDYSEQSETAGGFQRRLFADDAAQGFAFIDLCRKRYDVAVMNPPFGEFSSKWKKLAVEVYPNTRNDIFAAFTERMLDVVIPGGAVGAITSRTGLFITSLELWRRNVILGGARLCCLADLGDGVMDNAMVEAAAYCFDKAPPTKRALFIRSLLARDRDFAILDAISKLRDGCQPPYVFFPPLKQFELLPDSPMVYWTNKDALHSFSLWPELKDAAGDVRQGLATADDPRFARAIWEIPYEERRYKANGRRWVPYVKAGASQPWFSPITLLVNWGGEAAELWNNLNSQGKVRSNIWMLKDAIRLHFFKPGFSWTRRAVRFIPYVVPEGCIPSASRYLAYPHADKTFSLMGVSASNVASVFLRFYGEMFQRPNYMVETVKLLPWPGVTSALSRKLQEHIDAQVRQRRRAYQNHEPFHEFTLPFKVWSDGTSPDALEFNYGSLLDPQLEMEIADAYQLSGDHVESASLDLNEALHFRGSDKENDDSEEKDFVIDVSERAQNDALISYALGTAFGRWDIRYATGERPAPELPNPFAPLPVCPPGMLQGDDGLPLSPEAGHRLRTEGRYPLDVAWDGILVDDPEHPLDLERRVHAALAVLWSDCVDALEHEACALLGVPTLREWFRRPAGFFADHLKRYSKSRRQAPIYWPLSTASGSYTLWIYYHRLTPDTIYKCIQQFIDPKLAEVERELTHARALLDGGEGTAKTRQQLEDLESLRQELKELRAELEHWAPRWKPNLNDGVLITACPLWKLFRLPKWQKDLKTCWDSLEKGDYDWAHLAYTLWPDRVREKCKKDRSLAIAHELEEICEVKPAEKKTKGKKGKKAVASAEPEDEPTEANAEQQGLELEVESKPPPKVAKPQARAESDEPDGDDEPAQSRPQPIDQTDRTEVLCMIRQVFNDGQERDRESAIRDVARALGYQRAGSRIQEILHNDLLTAVRRGILQNERGMLCLVIRDVRDYERDSLKDDFLSAMGRGWIEREEAIRLFARWLGYARTGPVIDEMARSLINGLIRDGRLETEGSLIRRNNG